MAKAYVVKEKNDHVRLYNGTLSAIEQGDFVVLGDLCGVADEDIANLAVGSVHVEEGLIVQASEFVSGEDTFNTPHQLVYFDPFSGQFSDTSSPLYRVVGQLQEVKSGGVIRFMKFRRAPLVANITLSQITDLANLSITMNQISNLANLKITMSQVSDLKDLALEDLADVNLVGVTDKDRLAYDSTTSKWIPEAVAD